ncbi:MAG TPA: DUF805 domain-containing protein [Caulobacteraceae bacterium]|jgi:uncharacterized membrane protein YhaH (DUF805 family)
MAGGIDLAELFLSSAGRIGRRAFAAAGAVLLAVALAWRLLTPPEWPWWAGLPVYAPVLFSAACVASKRFHDRGRSGWWGLILFPALLLAWAQGPALLGEMGWRRWVGLAALLVVGSSAVQLLLLRGQPGFNRWGPAD